MCLQKYKNKIYISYKIQNKIYKFLQEYETKYIYLFIYMITKIQKQNLHKPTRIQTQNLLIPTRI